ncbi:MAG TPA: hypothetical protein VIX42_07365 [Edaphobacter sp.]
MMNAKSNGDGDRNGNDNGQYRDLSTAAAKTPPSVEMTFVVGLEKQKQIP